MDSTINVQPSVSSPAPEADPAKLEAFMGKLVGDMSAAMSGPLVIIGAKLGLYRALADAGPSTAVELAGRTGLTERYVREWLAGQAASGYVEYDPVRARFSLSPEQAMGSPTRIRRSMSPARSNSSPLAISTSQKSAKRSGAALESAGTSIMSACSAAPSAFSERATVLTCWPTGCPRSTAWRRSSLTEPRSPTSAAATARRRS